MQTEALKAARHLENARELRRLAADLRTSDWEAAEKLIAVAEDYERGWQSSSCRRERANFKLRHYRQISHNIAYTKFGLGRTRLAHDAQNAHPFNSGRCSGRSLVWSRRCIRPR